MKKLQYYGIATSMVAGAIIGAASISDARSVSAFLGQPQVPGDYTCFSNFNGSVRNNCSTTRRFCVALPVDSASHDVTVNVLAPDSSHNISCFATAVTRETFNAGSTPAKSVTTGFGSFQILALGLVSVPSFGALFACCDIAPTASAQTISY